MDIILACERPPGKTVPSNTQNRPVLVTPGETISKDTSFMR